MCLYHLSKRLGVPYGDEETIACVLPPPPVLHVAVKYISSPPLFKSIHNTEALDAFQTLRLVGKTLLRRVCI